MERTFSRDCSPEQAFSLGRNKDRYARIGNAHVRIHAPTFKAPIMPPSPPQYRASIEVLGSEDAAWGPADDDAVNAVTELFGNVLRDAVDKK